MLLLLFTALWIVACDETAQGQLIFHEYDDSYTCTTPMAAYCGGESGQTPIIIKCTKAGVGYPQQCDREINDHSKGIGEGSRCFESSPSAGDAGCVWEGTVYGPAGEYALPAGASIYNKSPSITPPKDVPVGNQASLLTSTQQSPISSSTGTPQPASETIDTSPALAQKNKSWPTQQSSPAESGSTSTSTVPKRKTLTVYQYVYHTVGIQASGTNRMDLGLTTFLSTAMPSNTLPVSTPSTPTPSATTSSHASPLRSASSTSRAKQTVTLVQTLRTVTASRSKTSSSTSAISTTTEVTSATSITGASSELSVSSTAVPVPTSYTTLPAKVSSASILKGNKTAPMFVFVGIAGFLAI